MFKKLLMLVCLGLMCFWCVTAEEQSKMLTVSGQFTAICAGGNVNVDYTPGPKVSVRVSGGKTALSTLNMKVKNGVLHIDTENKGRWDGAHDNTVKVVLTAPVMHSYAAHGNSEIEVKSSAGINGRLAVEASGNSRVEFDKAVSCTKVDLESSGNSKVEFEDGLDCKSVSADVSGNSRLEFEALKCGRMQVEVSGNARIKSERVAVDLLSGDASGNSSIKLRGRVGRHNVTTSGLARLEL